MKGKQNVEADILVVLPGSVPDDVQTAMKEDVSEMVSLFKLLSDPVRIHILKALELQELCVCILVEITDYKYSALSYHLKLLKEAEMVESKRERNYQIYYLTDFGRTLLATIESAFN
ncbi:metalloregulator ArsR/SmtB family transcription factor [Methanolobus sp. ZRKC3]|uniref:ArsR/SmtB family transcription factor n=1 Tax=Methanolobus sp. ZRKC3 TaxID=3125786 RepID=UPI003250A4FB